jgi:hypothetical protein
MYYDIYRKAENNWQGLLCFQFYPMPSHGHCLGMMNTYSYLLALLLSLPSYTELA